MSVAIDVSLHVISLAFSQGGHIPKKYTCEGNNVNPPLEISNLPEKTKTLAIIVEDPDAPHGIFDHWIVWNILPNEPIAENSVPGINGVNSFGTEGYRGPCPPSGSHRYFFKVYALDSLLDLPAGSNKKALQQAMQGHVLSFGELMAHYKKSNSL
jgi:Raf kinase inhibitor-like YbhB/YbcL family protein